MKREILEFSFKGKYCKFEVYSRTPHSLNGVQGYLLRMFRPKGGVAYEAFEEVKRNPNEGFLESNFITTRKFLGESSDQDKNMDRNFWNK